MRRVVIGPIALDDLSPGEVKKVTSESWEKLKEYKKRALKHDESR